MFSEVFFYLEYFISVLYQFTIGWYLQLYLALLYLSYNNIIFHYFIFEQK